MEFQRLILPTSIVINKIGVIFLSFLITIYFYCVDFLYSDKYKQHLIIEASIFNEIDPPSIETRLEGVPGFYNISDPENICYEEGAFWFPELIAESIIKQWIIENT